MDGASPIMNVSSSGVILRVLMRAPRRERTSSSKRMARDRAEHHLFIVRSLLYLHPVVWLGLGRLVCPDKPQIVRTLAPDWRCHAATVGGGCES
jgi:hypothetical protein